ncbi:MAG: thymidine phosphorylase [Pseudomonadota bacterium]
MRTQELIRIKRDNGEMPDEAIREFITGVTNGGIADYQISALLMAIFCRGMSDAELSCWTDAMLNSGRVLDLSSIDGIKVDKHSTGGVGDKVSICLAPLVAACGVPVPMISGRGLGHTGGTLDKLESIPGFRTDLEVPRFVQMVKEIGLSLIGQTSDLAPADRKLYALRDVTSTVESIPLISSSIMSKKLAEGIDALVLDVKVGSGAFMKDLDSARALAATLCGVGRRAGKNVTAFLSDMSQPLGREIGNANEIKEAIELLRGNAPEDLLEITLELGAEMLILGKAAKRHDKARTKIQEAISNGAGLEKFRRCIEYQGGNAKVVDNLNLFPKTAHQMEITAEQNNFLCAIDAEKIGIAAMVLGAGRQRVTDTIDHSVGITLKVRLGDYVHKGNPLATLYYNDAKSAHLAKDIFLKACNWSNEKIVPPQLIHEVLR